MTGPARRIGIYAINLDRAADRWADIRRWFEPMGFALHRVPGLDARSEPEAVLAFRGLVPILPPSGVGWTRHRGRLFSLGEEACFCGHLKAFGQFLAGDDDLALVLEDDAQPVGELAAFLDALARSDFAFDIIKLEGIRHHGARAAVEDARFAGVAVVRAMRPSSGSAAYLITRAAARRLLDRAGRLLCPYDDYLQSPQLTGCRVWQVSPWLIHQSGRATTLARTGSQGRAPTRNTLGSFVMDRVHRARWRLVIWAHALVDPRGRIRLPRRAPW